jgi:Flp pilus assembly protein TadD/outer membrane protein OmpA-like peptidoglycan-associated protein
MRNLKSVLVMMLALVIVSCGSLKLPNFHVNPSPLVNNGGTVSFTIQDTIQPKSFPKKLVVKLQPYMKFGADTINLEPIYLKGEKAKEGTGKVVAWKTATPLVYQTSFKYKPEMQVSELWVKAYTIAKGVETEASDVKIADGIIVTSTRVGQSENVAFAKDGYEKETIVSKTANLYFGYQKSNLNTGLKLNKDHKAELDELNNFFAQGWKVKSVTVNAWASPEGELSLNQKLSDERGATAKKYLDKQAKKNKIEGVEVMVNAKGADYDGFMAALNASDVQDKNKIANVIKSQATKSQREQQIRNMTVIYKEVEEMLSVLRRAEMTIALYEPKLTDAQIAEYATTNPDTLKMNELLYAATMTDDMNAKLAIYKSAIKKDEKCWRAYNNAAAADMKLGNTDEAAQYLEKANTLKANQGEVENNLGVLAAWNKDYEAAETHYNNATGVNTDHNMGIIKMIKGDYTGAESALSDKKCTYDLALAQLANGKTDEAIKTLDCGEKTGEVYYLYAIIGARTNNTNMLYDNLKKAIKEVPSYKEEAKKDLEFYNFKDVAEFQNIIK